jgi:hypothetical protein
MAPAPPANQDSIISYLLLRKSLGWIAIAMPFALGFGAWFFEGIPWADSISAYYYTSMRDVFVGTMFAVGVFLFCYRGRNRQDNIVTNLAGIAAAAIGLAARDIDPVARALGVLMLVCFGAIALLKWLWKEASIVVPETGAIVAFAIAWLTKGHAILPD